MIENLLKMGVKTTPETLSKLMYLRQWAMYDIILELFCHHLQFTVFFLKPQVRFIKMALHHISLLFCSKQKTYLLYFGNCLDNLFKFLVLCVESCVKFSLSHKLCWRNPNARNKVVSGTRPQRQNTYGTLFTHLMYYENHWWKKKSYCPTFSFFQFL